MKTAVLLLALMLLTGTAAGCNQTVSPTPLKITSVIPVKEVAIYFPVEKEPAKGYMLLSLQGKLLIDDSGYIRVEWTEKEHPLIIWPYGYTLQKAKNDDAWVTDEQGQLAWRVGDIIDLGGGFAGKDIVEQRIGKSLPEGCEGPYFLAGPR
jgi:hypothetical protein